MSEREKVILNVALDLAMSDRPAYEFTQLPERDLNGDAYTIVGFPDELTTYPHVFTSAELVDIAKRIMYKSMNSRAQPYVLGFCPSSITLVKQ
jgi:hypothetical protein